MRRVMLWGAPFFCLVAVCAAQLDKASIVGSVTDSSGAVVACAKDQLNINAYGVPTPAPGNFGTLGRNTAR